MLISGLSVQLEVAFLNVGLDIALLLGDRVTGLGVLALTNVGGSVGIGHPRCGDGQERIGWGGKEVLTGADIFAGDRYTLFFVPLGDYR